MDQKDFKRESAVRMFAKEFNATRFETKFDESDDKAPTFVLTLTGACANRILISGVLTTKEKKTDKNVLYTGRINDNTGDFKVTASHFNPNAQQQMAAIKETPVFVTVIGKPSIYKREDGRIFQTVRIEDIVVTDKLTRDLWVLDTARATYNRIALMEKGDDGWLKDIQNKYNITDYTQVKNMLKGVVNAIVE